MLQQKTLIMQQPDEGVRNRRSELARIQFMGKGVERQGIVPEKR